MTTCQTFRLLSESHIPLVGVGTYRVTDKDTIYQILDESLKTGYRLIDTAAGYRNEEYIGSALKELLPKYKLKREDIFLTSKLPPSDNGDAIKINNCVENSLKYLQTPYIDLYLIHWPGAAKIHENSESQSKLRALTWLTLNELKKKNKLKCIGVSNFTIRHLEQLIVDCNGILPDVNQVECHPHYRQDELIKYCNKKEIFVQAYSSLGSTGNIHLLSDPVVIKISTDLRVSPARVLLKWALQRNLGVIPKAIKLNHIRDNIRLDFEMNQDQMEQLSKLHQTKYTWNPDNVA